MNVPRCTQGRPAAPPPDLWDYATVVRALERRYTVSAWHGPYTGRWWAMVDGRCLVEADTPGQLGERIQIVRSRWPR
ncbi:hypothetical protein BZB76_4980 [Actinomadura pelletieri DSM 43383]|uniref:Uncharacterized protein n=1 Tax=Actinomadura pelletieri DSM 43383 TaxID=1120940 RepID=A0A495QJ39_9ACTN|nr:hypothetical protein [Actinomadura pelletieri]RKS72163.1 hypothetical protein BZB76_4980 [Actinomadura pelletieri DSM 43383]